MIDIKRWVKPRNTKKPGTKRQSGVALVTALLIVSLATIMAVSLMSRQYIDIRRTGNIMLSDQAYLYSLAMENFAGQLLAFYRSQGQSKFDSRADFEAAMMQFSAFPVEGGSVAVSVSYPESMFNVNNLVDNNGKPVPQQVNRYRRLLNSVMSDLGAPAQTDDLVNSLIDWLDPDQSPRPGGAEDGVYEGKSIPYKTANQMMSSISELRLVDGYGRELLYGIPGDENNPPVAGLLSYVTALPDRATLLNINLVTEAKQFDALSQHIDDVMADDLLVTATPYEKISEFSSSNTLDSVKTTRPQGSNQSNRQELDDDIRGILGVQSRYFLLKGVATVGQARIDLNSLIYVKDDGTKLEVIFRSIGTNGI